MESVEGVHYIVDRYAVINQFLITYFSRQKSFAPGLKPRLAVDFEKNSRALTYLAVTGEGEPAAFKTPEDEAAFFLIGPQSGQDQISRAVRHARSLYHPDRFEDMPEDIQQNAATNFARIGQAAEILLDETLRPLYTERLLDFYARDPRTVSVSGQVIVPLGGKQDFFSLDTLLQAAPDSRAQIKHIAATVGYDDAAFQAVQSHYRAAPDNEALRVAYREALGRRLVYLTLREDVAWSHIGFGHKQSKTAGPVLDGDSYARQVEEELSRTAETVLPQAVLQRNDALRIGAAKPPLLLTGPAPTTGQSVRTMDDDTMARVVETARAALYDRAGEIRRLAVAKQDTLIELADMASYRPLNAVSARDSRHVLLVGSQNAEGKDVFMFGFAFDARDGKVTLREDTLEFHGVPVDDIMNRMKGILPCANVFLLMRNDMIDEHYVEILAAAKQITAGWEALQPPAPPVCRP